MRSFSRLLGAALVVGSLALAFAIRLLSGPMVETTGLLQQISGTALYASAFYGGVLILWPRGRPLPVALISIAFC